jgi:CRP-like cAMP-binding protein
MPKNSTPSRFKNRLLAQMTREQTALIEPALEAVTLERHKSLETRDRKIEYVYFVESGLVSVVANERGGESIEVGVVGSEGLTGFALLLNTDRTALDTLVQIDGTAQRMRADKLRAAMDENHGLNRLDALRTRLHDAGGFHRARQWPAQRGRAPGALAADGA